MKTVVVSQRAIFELEEQADLLRDCDRRADEHFRILDLMEEQA